MCAVQAVVVTVRWRIRSANTYVVISDGIIGGNVYAGSEAVALIGGSSMVNGTATLRNIDSSNVFAQNFGTT